MSSKHNVMYAVNALCNFRTLSEIGQSMNENTNKDFVLANEVDSIVNVYNHRKHSALMKNKKVYSPHLFLKDNIIPQVKFQNLSKDDPSVSANGFNYEKNQNLVEGKMAKFTQKWPIGQQVD